MMTPLYAGVFLACTGCSIALIGAPWLAKDWGTNELELGVLMSSAMVWLVVLCPVAGCAAERWGSGWLVRFALILSAASLLLMSRCHTLSTLIVTLSLFGLSQALYWPAVEVQLAFGAGGNELARRIGAFNIAWGTGAALGGWLTGALYSVAPPLTFVVGAILFAAAWVVTERALRALPLAVVKSQESRVKSQESRVKTQDSRLLYASWAANFAGWFCIESAQTLLPALARKVHVGDVQWGVVMFMLYASKTLAFGLLWFWHGWQGRRLYVVLLAALAGAAFIFIVEIPHWLVWAGALSVVGAFAGLAYTASLYYSLHSPDGRGTRTGWHESIGVSGALAGPLLGGVVGKMWGSQAPMLFCAAVLFLLAFVYLRSAAVRR